MRWIYLFLFLTASLSAGTLRIAVEGESALVMNAKTGQVLFEKNGHTQIFPASTTKIATALLALHKARGQLEQIITAEREALVSITPEAKKQSNYRSPPHWIESDSSHIGIKKGEELRLFDLLNGMMIASGNDAANVIALGLGGTIPKYMDEVNAYLKSIGCKNTHFNNPHGLHHPEHFTTAYELALMARAALKDPVLRHIVSTPRYTSPQTNLEEERTFIQTNLLLRSGTHHYPQAIGVKTGYTQAAGKNLVAAAKSGDRELIVVATGYRGPRSELYKDVKKMFEVSFNEPKMRRFLLPKGQQKLTARVQGARGQLLTCLSEGLAYEFYPTEEVPVRVVATWEIPPLPIMRGAPVGKVKVLDDQGAVIGQVPLLAFEDVNPTIWHRISAFLSQDKLGRKLTFGAGVGLILLFFLGARKKRMRSYR